MGSLDLEDWVGAHHESEVRGPQSSTVRSYGGTPAQIKPVESSRALRLFTLGHSNHSPERFMELVEKFEVEVVVDVRSQPDATYLPHFERGPVSRLLSNAGIRYLFLGEELGGRPTGDEFYDADGYVLYGRWAKSPSFQKGLERLALGCQRFRVVIMCSEEDPTSCHRRLLIGRALALRYALSLNHIRGNGDLQTEDGPALQALGHTQLGLFDTEGDEAWRSARSVLRRSRPAPSSAF
jgi:hypothetical protein